MKRGASNEPSCRQWQSFQAGGRQKGIALIIVLWILLLVTISTGAYTLMARMDQLEAHTVISSTRARMAAEAGLNLAVLSLRDPDELTRMVPDGRPYTFQVGDVMVEIQVTDERGKIDINVVSRGDPGCNCFRAMAWRMRCATYLAAAMLDWIRYRRN